MTFDQASVRLEERGLRLVRDWNPNKNPDADKTVVWVVHRPGGEEPDVIATGWTWQEAYATAMGEAPF